MGKANTRIPYASTVQLENQWITDPPAVRGEKQWERYTNNNAGHLDWTAKTNDHDVRIPYIHGAALAQGDDKKTAATWTVKGEKQWQDWAQAHNDALDHQTGKANTRLPYASTLSQNQHVQVEGDDTLDTPAVRGEKQWEYYASHHDDAKRHWANRTLQNPHETRTPYISAQVQLEEQGMEGPKP